MCGSSLKLPSAVDCNQIKRRRKNKKERKKNKQTKNRFHPFVFFRKVQAHAEMENGSFFDDPSAATAATASNSSAAGGARTPHSALPLTVPHGPTSVVRLTQAPGAGDVPDGQKSPSVKLVVCRARYRQRFAAVPTVVGFRKTPLRHWKRCRFYDFNFLWELSFFLSFFFSFSFLLCGLYLSGNSIQTPDAAAAAFCCWRCACGWRVVAAVHLLSKAGLFCFRFVLRHALSLHLNAHLLESVSLLLLWSRLFAHQTVVRSGSFMVTGGALAQVGSNFHTLPGVLYLVSVIAAFFSPPFFFFLVLFLSLPFPLLFFSSSFFPTNANGVYNVIICRADSNHRAFQSLSLSP